MTDPPRMRPESRRDRIPLHRRVYPFRVFGMAVGGIPVAVALYPLDPAPTAWLFLLLTSLVWPHVAYLIALRSRDPYQAETRNLLIDTAIAGAWVPLIHFNLLPSALLVTLTLVDKISTGLRGLGLRAMPWLLVGGVAMGLVTGGAFDPHTSMTVIAACLPVLLIHTVAVSLGSYRLIRKVGLQNKELDRLHRLDPLTGLSNRADWEQHAENILQQSLHSSRSACLLLIDIDDFKLVNDTHGHAAGDEVLCALANKIRTALRPKDRAGRIGGDEFVVVLPGTTLDQAEGVAERIRSTVETIRLRDHADVHPTISVGVAVAGGTATTLRGWFNHADRALSLAKDSGRNRIAASTASAAPVSATPA